MNEQNTSQPEITKPSLRGKLRRLLGTTATEIHEKVADSEQQAYEQNAEARYEALLEDAKGINRQAAQAIKDLVERPGSNRQLAGHVTKGVDGRVLQWSSHVAFNEQRQGSPYTQLETDVQPSISYMGSKIPVDQISLNVGRKINKTNLGDPYTEIILNGAKQSGEAPNATKWIIRLETDGSIESARTNLKSQSPNAMTFVDVTALEGLGDMMTQLHFAIHSNRNVS